MNASISPADLRRPGDYKARYERSEYKRMRLEDELRKAQTETQQPEAYTHAEAV